MKENVDWLLDVEEHRNVDFELNILDFYDIFARIYFVISSE